MRKGRNVIVSCAVTGSIHTPSMSPHLPVTPLQIADQAVGAVKAAAAIVHLHGRIPENGEPVRDQAVYAQFLPAIATRCDGIINRTTGGGGDRTRSGRTVLGQWPCHRTGRVRPPDRAESGYLVPIGRKLDTA